SPVPIRHGTELHLHLGTTETTARVWLLESAELAPGQTGFAQLGLGAALPGAPGDRVVLRRPTPAATVGGGAVLDVAPRRHRRHDATVGAALAERRDAGPAELVALVLRDQRLGAEAATLACLGGMGTALCERALRKMGPHALQLGRRWIAPARWDELAASSTRLLTAHHQADPLSPGMPREEWRTRLRLTATLGADVAHRLVAEGRLEEHGAVVALPGLGVRVDASSRSSAEAVADLLSARGFDAPSTGELRAAGLTPGLLRLLIAEDKAVRLSAEVVISAEAYGLARRRVEAHLAAHTSATVAALRDAVGATRRVMLPLLERLDADGLTLRDGDVRRLRRPLGVTP
ncbi:MAG TPA: SelB C-terminal domain-containing protein, partial [Candidatus Dormibacteraeota bacterium]